MLRGSFALPRQQTTSACVHVLTSHATDVVLATEVLFTTGGSLLRGLQRGGSHQSEGAVRADLVTAATTTDKSNKNGVVRANGTPVRVNSTNHDKHM